MHDDKARHQHHGDEVQGTCTLVAAEEFDVPREAGPDGRGHRYSGEDEKRRQDKDDEGVAQHLQGVIGG